MLCSNSMVSESETHGPPWMGLYTQLATLWVRDFAIPFLTLYRYSQSLRLVGPCGWASTHSLLHCSLGSRYTTLNFVPEFSQFQQGKRGHLEWR